MKINLKSVHRPERAQQHFAKSKEPILCIKTDKNGIKTQSIANTYIDAMWFYQNPKKRARVMAKYPQIILPIDVRTP